MATFPGLLYKDGLTNITDIPAATKMAIWFAFVVATQVNDAHSLLHKQNAISENYVNVINACKILLCYWAWLKKKSFEIGKTAMQ